MTIFYVGRTLRKAHIIKTDRIIKDLKDKYAGQHKRIFIVATGPSLKVEDLNWLESNQELAISCNGIFKIFGQTTWRPDYYVLDDYYVYEKYLKEDRSIRLETFVKKKVILSGPLRRRLKYKYDKERIGFIPMCYFDHWFTNESHQFKYDRNMQFGHYDAYTVTNFAINLADYMGIERVYLLGTDCNYTESILHCGENEKSQLTSQEADSLRNAQIRGYENSKRGVKVSGMGIYNATRGGHLEVFPRVCMDDIIEAQG